MSLKPDSTARVGQLSSRRCSWRTSVIEPWTGGSNPVVSLHCPRMCVISRESTGEPMATATQTKHHHDHGR